MKKNKIEELQAFLKEEPEDSFIKYALALECIKIENFEKGTSYLNDILERDENYLAAYYQLGKALERIGQQERASSIYLKGIEIAGELGKKHTLSELQQAYNLLKGLDDEYIE